MKKAYFLLIMVLFSGLNLVAQNQKSELAELAGAAELILKGQISSTKGFNFEVKVQQVIAGDYSDELITIRKYKNFKAIKRWAKYQEGEEVLVFLQKDEDTWKLLGYNGEGEKFVNGEDVYLDSRGGAVINRFQYHNMPLGGNIYAEKVKVSDLISAIQGFRDLFDFSYHEVSEEEGEVHTEPRYSFKGEPAALDSYRAQSEIHNRMASDAGQ